MKRTIAKHAFYLMLLAVIVFGAYEYHAASMEGLRYDLAAQVQNISANVNTLRSEITGEVTALQSDLTLTKTELTQKDEALTQGVLQTRTELGLQIQATKQSLESNVQQLNTELTKKDTELRSLSGELADVKEQSSQIQDRITLLKEQNKDFSDIIDSVIPAVVSVQSGNSRGSGFLIDPVGYIVTNHHVIQDPASVSALTSDGQVRSARVVGTDSGMDVAVLKVEGSFSKLAFGNSDAVKVGEKVIAIGSPGGLDFTVTQGIVSAINRVDAGGRKLIQTDVPVNPGNSGGPLVNIAGEVIGVATLKASGFEGIGFALSSNQVKTITDGMIANDQN